jgi:hypothetical protein
VASQVIMDDGAESTMTKHSRRARRWGTDWLDDEYPSGQHCFRQQGFRQHSFLRHCAPHQVMRRAPAERGRPDQREEAEEQNGDPARSARNPHRA